MTSNRAIDHYYWVCAAFDKVGRTLPSLVAAKVVALVVQGSTTNATTFAATQFSRSTKVKSPVTLFLKKKIKIANVQ